MTRPPVAVTIAGSDSSGGAGIQADLKTFSALGVYGMSVITAVTAQNTQAVTGVHCIPADVVAQQLHALIADIRIDAMKIGMVATAEIADTIGGFLRRYPHEVVVLDPVMVATSGDRLLAPEAVEAVRHLIPLVSIMTPNLPEAADLLGVDVATDVAQMRRQARMLVSAGARRVLLKGGHLADGHAVDVFASSEVTEVLTAPRISTHSTHGTGCTLSSAIAALRVQRPSWLAAVTDAKQWLTGAIAGGGSLDIGHGHGPVHHFYQIW